MRKDDFFCVIGKFLARSTNLFLFVLLPIGKDYCFAAKLQNLSRPRNATFKYKPIRKFMLAKFLILQSMLWTHNRDSFLKVTTGMCPGESLAQGLWISLQKMVGATEKILTQRNTPEP